MLFELDLETLATLPSLSTGIFVRRVPLPGIVEILPRFCRWGRKS
ncbi:hypothetical protein D082_09320 [Synechocystis sp. PCC 6714]|nr:hypothetical protein D082_09320 [Synechocystis sp. PCC 6714]